jgi:hypothetical protein
MKRWLWRLLFRFADWRASRALARARWWTERARRASLRGPDRSKADQKQINH